MDENIKLNKIFKNLIFTVNKIRLQLKFSREVGTIIKDKFDGATEVAIIEEDNKPTIVRKNVQFKRHTKADLVNIFLSFMFERDENMK